mmetsp:Transcript_48466/g.117271  ORF Transcript_48466/g.117271 Transcript_48466/m.117271 type:complete len:242 (-) Transcript_48466:102-827(-)
MNTSTSHPSNNSSNSGGAAAGSSGSHQVQRQTSSSSSPRNHPPSTTSASSASSLPHEERLTIYWKRLLASMSEILRKAEKAYNVNSTSSSASSSSSSSATGGSSSGQQQTQPPPLSQNQRKVLLGEVDSNIVLFYKTKTEFMRLLSHVEAKLLGKADEMISLESFVRTTPKVGSIVESSNRFADADNRSTAATEIDLQALDGTSGDGGDNNSTKRGRDGEQVSWDGGGDDGTMSKKPRLDV